MYHIFVALYFFVKKNKGNTMKEYETHAPFCALALELELENFKRGLKQEVNEGKRYRLQANILYRQKARIKRENEGYVFMVV